MTREEHAVSESLCKYSVAENWRRNVRYSRALYNFSQLLLRRDDWERWKYIGSFTIDRRNDVGGVAWTAAYRAISTSEIGGPGKPFRNPYFLMENDRQLMLAKLLLTTMKAWDFRTAKQVMRS
jgi:hypothetical protein